MFSYFVRPVGQTVPKWKCEIEDVWRYLRSGHARRETERLRATDEAEEHRRYKMGNFDFVTFSGIFRRRHYMDIVTHSGLMCMDIDHIGGESELREWKRRLAADTRLKPKLIFTSPSGDGLKLVLKVGEPVSGDPTGIAIWHKRQYEKAAREIERRHGLRCDKTSDVARACFVGWDPEAWMEGAGFGPESGMKPKTKGIWERFTPLERVEILVRKTEREHRDVTADYRDWLRLGFGMAFEFGESGRELFHRVSRLNPRYSRQEADMKYDECLAHADGRAKLGTVMQILKAR